MIIILLQFLIVYGLIGGMLSLIDHARYILHDKKDDSHNFYSSDSVFFIVFWPFALVVIIIAKFSDLLQWIVSAPRDEVVPKIEPIDLPTLEKRKANLIRELQEVDGIIHAMNRRGN